MELASPKGTHDLLPKALATWQYVEFVGRKLFECANIHEIRTPIFEATELFERGVGESTDIVNKEMYSFEKGDRQLTLRPENTAGVVRAYLQHGMDRLAKPVKLYYFGPMFRYERPQAGRQRQFHQVGVEIFGVDTPQSDASAIILAIDLLQALKVPQLSLEINNVGCFECRQDFRDQFKAFIQPYLPQLCEDCQRRFVTNPLRMLDCKVPSCKAIYEKPEIVAFLEQDNTCEGCQQHFSTLLDILERCDIPYQRNKMLVRGLDYYTRTVFEITSTHLGAQNAVCGGGRYNGLVKMLGGPDTPAVGWAMGMERLISLVPEMKSPTLDFYVASDDIVSAINMVRSIQRAGFSVETDTTGKPMGKQFALANKLEARYVVALGEQERQNKQVSVKNMTDGTQETLSQEEFMGKLFPHHNHHHAADHSCC